MNVLEKINQAKEDINEILEDLIDNIVAGYPQDNPSTVKIKTKLKKVKSNFTKKISMPMNDSDKRVIIGLFKKGKDTQHVNTKFPQYSTGQIAAVKAHVTMGTY